MKKLTIANGKLHTFAEITLNRVCVRVCLCARA